MAQETIRAGTSALDSDTGLELATKLNANFTEIYNDKHIHVNKTIIDSITSTDITNWNAAIQEEDLEDFVTEAPEDGKVYGRQDADWVEIVADVSDEIDTAIAAHNVSGTAHADIRTQITTDIATHNTSGTAHSDIRTQITTDIATHNASTTAHADIRQDILDLTGRVESLESLGEFVGAFDTFAEVSTDATDFDAITVNDFIIVRVDETKGNQPTMYMAVDITADVITWEYVLTLSTDITGKLSLSGGTMTGPLITQSNTQYSTAQARNIIISDVDLIPGVSSLTSGYIYLVYE